jgi:hypothetical protein
MKLFVRKEGFFGAKVNGFAIFVVHCALPHGLDRELQCLV